MLINDDCAGLGSFGFALSADFQVQEIVASEQDTALATALGARYMLVSDDMRRQRWQHLGLAPGLIDFDALGFPWWLSWKWW